MFELKKPTQNTLRGFLFMYSKMNTQMVYSYRTATNKLKIHTAFDCLFLKQSIKNKNNEYFFVNWTKKYIYTMGARFETKYTLLALIYHITC